MVKVFKHTHRYDDQPSTVLLAFYLRYPNPYATHVLSCDVISRKVDPVRGAITTQRLILKKGIVPRWARTWLENWGMMGGGGLEAWVLEESEVTIDPRTNQPVLTSMTRNISHKKIIHVAEGTEFHPAGPARGTIQKTTAYVSSNFGSGSGLSALVRGRIEQYGAGRFERNAKNAREGMSLILSLLRNYEPLPHTSEAELAAGPSTTSRPYGYNYATRGNVYDSQRTGERESDDAEEQGSTERPGWDQGRRFRYDPPASERFGIAATARGQNTSNSLPSASFLSNKNLAVSNALSPSDESDGRPRTTPSTSKLPSTSPTTSLAATTNDSGLANLLISNMSPAPASFFLSQRNPALYPGLREKLQAKKERARKEAQELGLSPTDQHPAT